MKVEMKKKYILAEMAASHEGDLKIAEFIITAAAKAGADGILFQMINLDTYIIPSDEEFADIKSFAMGQQNWQKLIKKANGLNLDVWANVYDLKTAVFCRKQDIKGYKLHSANLESEDLIREIAKAKKEILLSVGGVENQELTRVLKLIHSANKNPKICLMYGLQNFPTRPEAINLNFIKELSRKLKLSFGYQDHSDPESAASTFLPILFLVSGAEIIEKHITHDRSKKGQDYEAALNPNEFASFVKDIRTVENIISKSPAETSADEVKYKEYKTLMKVVAKQEIKAGEKFSIENVTIMRSRVGEVAGRDLNLLIGKKSQQSYKKFESIKRDEFLKAGIFITARLKSKRLPMKVIKPILGKPMIVWMIERLKRCNISPIVLMTSTNPQDGPLIEIAKQQGIEFFRGSEEDVLLRMRDCARKFDRDFIISVTADDPLKEPIFIKKMLEKYIEKPFDFCEIEGLPNGCESYAVSRKALEKVCDIKKESDTEIWGDYFRKTKTKSGAIYFRKSGKFKCEMIRIADPAILKPYYRITVDTPEDFEVVSKIFEILLKEKGYPERSEEQRQDSSRSEVPFFNVYDICKLLDERPDLVAINKNIEQKKAPNIKIRKKRIKDI